VQNRRTRGGVAHPLHPAQLTFPAGRLAATTQPLATGSATTAASFDAGGSATATDASPSRS
jgi:hypothetical protein